MISLKHLSNLFRIKSKVEWGRIAHCRAVPLKHSFSGDLVGWRFKISKSDNFSVYFDFSCTFASSVLGRGSAGLSGNRQKLAETNRRIRIFAGVCKRGPLFSKMGFGLIYSSRGRRGHSERPGES